MKFISQAEGYIEPDGAGGYDYVYQHKDHLGNVRVSYSDNNSDGTVDPSEIRNEQNYYPFGLVHQGYNSSVFGVKNNLKTFQEQEFTEDLELNIHEWKYRFSDPAIGCFWQIDPLATDYVYNSTYAFSENKVVSHVELEGLEAVWSAAHASRNPETGKFIRENPKTAAAIASIPIIIATAGIGVEALPIMENLFIRGAIVASNPANQILVGEAGAFLAGLIDPLPGNDYSPGFGDQVGQALRGVFKTLDIGGGEISKYANAINIDPKM